MALRQHLLASAGLWLRIDDLAGLRVGSGEQLASVLVDEKGYFQPTHLPFLPHEGARGPVNAHSAHLQPPLAVLEHLDDARPTARGLRVDVHSPLPTEVVAPQGHAGLQLPLSTRRHPVLVLLVHLQELSSLLHPRLRLDHGLDVARLLGGRLLPGRCDLLLPGRLLRRQAIRTIWNAGGLLGHFHLDVVFLQCGDNVLLLHTGGNVDLVLLGQVLELCNRHRAQLLVHRDHYADRIARGAVRRHPPVLLEQRRDVVLVVTRLAQEGLAVLAVTCGELLRGPLASLAFSLDVLFLRRQHLLLLLR
mmetsp:Transcript_32888/g.94412  ORF Transcript_32888/g.94412 Transcript_32888/m.94412 type:complete len:305 (-) Transcript_32888:2511-3425(-)